MIEGVNSNSQTQYTMQNLGIQEGSDEASIFKKIDLSDGKEDGYLTQQQYEQYNVDIQTKINNAKQQAQSVGERKSLDVGDSGNDDIRPFVNNFNTRMAEIGKNFKEESDMRYFLWDGIDILEKEMQEGKSVTKAEVISVIENILKSSGTTILFEKKHYDNANDLYNDYIKSSKNPHDGINEDGTYDLPSVLGDFICGDIPVVDLDPPYGWPRDHWNNSAN